MRLRELLAAAVCAVASTVPAGAQAPPVDAVAIVRVGPTGSLTADSSARITVVADVTLASAEEARVELAFNIAHPQQTKSVVERTVTRGTRRLELSAEVTPRDWGRMAAFEAVVMLQPLAPLSVFKPLATARFAWAVRSAARSTAVDAGAFATLDAALRLKILSDIAASTSDLHVDEIVTLIPSQLRDRDRMIRIAALAAVSARTQASDRMSVRTAPGANRPNQNAPTPEAWKGDGAELRVRVYPEIARLVRDEEDEEVRLAAVATVNEMFWLTRYEFEETVPPLFAEIYRMDRSAAVRSSVVRRLAYSTSDHPAVGETLRAAFGDRSPEVRRMAATGLQRLHPAIPPRIAYAQVREAVAAGLADPDPRMRAAALSAVEIGHQEARELLSVLQRMSRDDPDETIRQHARRIVELIQ